MEHEDGYYGVMQGLKEIKWIFNKYKGCANPNISNHYKIHDFNCCPKHLS